MPNGRVCTEQQCQRNNWIRSIRAESGIHALAWMPTSFDTTFKGVKQFTLQVKWDLRVAHDMILYHVGDHVYLSTQNLTLPKGRARKLVPKYIRPYKVVKAHNEASTVTLKLPPVLVA